MTKCEFMIIFKGVPNKWLKLIKTEMVAKTFITRT